MHPHDAIARRLWDGIASADTDVLRKVIAPKAIWRMYGNSPFAGAHIGLEAILARCLQRCGLTLSPARHGRHHLAPCTVAYCISTGWLNPLLDGVGFWRGLEWVVSRLTGADPREPGARTSRMSPDSRRDGE